MTISQSIIEWLADFGERLEIVQTDTLEAIPETNGMYKNPERNVEYFNDGSRQITEYYTFLTKQNSLENEQRIDNTSFLESIEEWVENKNFTEDFPTLTNGVVTDIAIANSFYMQEADIDNATYQLSIEIIYIKERTNE